MIDRSRSMMKKDQPGSAMDTKACEEQYIRRALHLLERCAPVEAAEIASEGDDLEPGEALLMRLSLLVGSHDEAAHGLDRLRKELKVFKTVSTDANRMIEQKIEEISLLRLITDAGSRAMRTEDPLRLILGKVIGITGAESGSIMLQNGDAQRLEVRTVSGTENPGLEDPLPKLTWEVAERAMAGEEPIFVDDVQSETRFNLSPEEADGIGSFASFPLAVDGRIVGVLNLSSPHPNEFGAEAQRIMLIIAGQIAIVVENARLYGEVKETKEYLENLVERAGDAIFTLDGEHRIVSWNAGAETIFKREKQGVLGGPLYDMFPESMRAILREKVQSILHLNNIVTTEADLEQEGEEATRVTITLSPIHGADGEIVGVSGIAKDITKRRRIEEDLRQLNEAKSNFVSTVSHELRTPLTSIKSMTEVLSHEMDSLSKENIARYLNIINEECDRLSGLISDLLDLQKLTAGKMEPDFEKVRLAEVVRQATELFDGAAVKARVDLSAEFSAPDHMTTVMGNRGQLMRILSNLLSNSIKYTNPSDTINVNLSREGENVVLTITDTGIGIPDDQKEKVFEKFYRIDNPTTRNKGGTGLGLAITRELVTLHNGRIWVETEQDRGCSFTVLIPAADHSPE